MDISQLRDNAYNEVMKYMRENHPKFIDTAYDYFFEEENPDEFLSGAPLDYAFVNFEDWFVCDYMSPMMVSIIGFYKYKANPEGDIVKMLDAMEASYLTVYEVMESSPETLRLRDLLLGGETVLAPNPMPQTETGRYFGGRVIECGGEKVMGRCIYPFPAKLKDEIVASIEHGFRRFVKNKRPGAEMMRFLREEAYTMNMVWISFLYKN